MFGIRNKTTLKKVELTKDMGSETLYTLAAIPKSDTGSLENNASTTVSWVSLMLRHSKAVLAFNENGAWYMVVGICHSLFPEFVEVVVKDCNGLYERKEIPWHTHFDMWLGDKRK